MCEAGKFTASGMLISRKELILKLNFRKHVKGQNAYRKEILKVWNRLIR